MENTEFKDKLSKITATYDCKHDSNSRAEVLCYANISNPTQLCFQGNCMANLSDSSSALKCKCTALKCKLWARKTKAIINLVYDLLTTNKACTQNFKIKIKEILN